MTGIRSWICWVSSLAAVVTIAAVPCNYDGATYLFASAADKAAFDKNPAKYVPQYGGFCAYGISVGVLSDIEGPGGFVHDGNLYVCGDEAAGKSFRSDLKRNIAKADANWPKLVASQSAKR